MNQPAPLPDVVEGGTVLIRCKASRGMFPHEAAVLIRGQEFIYESMIDTDLLLIDGELDRLEKDALLEVGVVRINGEKLLIELPRQVVSGGRRIWVPKSEMQDGNTLAAGDRK